MKHFIALFSFASLLLISQVSCAQAPASGETIALSGYDVVAYFTANEAVRGNNSHTAIVDGSTYYFSSADHQKAFQKNPSKYLPQYGGNCAFGMAMTGTEVPSDPKTFKIRDGKLYLFYNDFYEGQPFNTIIPWNTNESESTLISKANASWSKFSK